jgi:hypothetical protein
MGRGLIGVGGDKGVSFVEVVVREPAQVAARKSQSGWHSPSVAAAGRAARENMS